MFGGQKMDLLAEIFMGIIFLLWAFIGFQWYGSFKAKVGIISDGCILPILGSVFFGSLVTAISMYRWYLGVPLTIIAIILVVRIIKTF